MAQEVGAHRRRPVQTPTAENEEWKRAFWSAPTHPLLFFVLTILFDRVLMCLHRVLGSFSGRQCVLQDEEYAVF